jgi:AcrR family transcriptional regulator
MRRGGLVFAEADDRPLRRDAEANRQRLLDAAAQVFAERGLEAGVEEIARVAGVGMGTLYRRFSTKDALIAALVHDVMATMLRLAREASERPDGTGLEYFLEAASAYQAAHRGCLPRLWEAGTEHDSAQEVRRLIAALLDEAKSRGRVRADIASTDLTMSFWSIRGVIETTRGAAPEAWRRHLDILIAGMRPAAGPLAHRPLTAAQLDEVIAKAQPAAARRTEPDPVLRPS